MKKCLLLIVSIAFSYLSFAQFGCEEGKKPNTKNNQDVKKRYPFAQKIEWKQCEYVKVKYATFTKGDTTYSLAYNEKNEWIATEKRIYKDIFNYDYEKDEVLKTTIPFATAKIFPKSLHSVLKNKDYDFNIKSYLKIKHLDEVGAIIECYTITLNDEHELVKKHKTNTFYIVNYLSLIHI